MFCMRAVAAPAAPQFLFFIYYAKPSAGAPSPAE